MITAKEASAICTQVNLKKETEIVESAIKCACQSGKRSCTVNVDSLSSETRQLLESNGFQIERETNYYGMPMPRWRISWN